MSLWSALQSLIDGKMFLASKETEWTGYTNSVIEDRKLSEHFSLYELTKTTHFDLQEKNRTLTDEQIQKLGQVADLLEMTRLILDVPLRIPSGYRCPELNAKVGSSLRSQHLLCEAADFIPLEMARDEAFRKLRHAAKDKRISFGQLIWEKVEDREGYKEWLHISLGSPYRAKEKCGQILTMVDGAYTLIETV